jgi:hypothetical protein
MSTAHFDADRALARLEAALVDAFDPGIYGLPWYVSIEDRVVRAVRSNQAIGLVDAAVSHVGALGESARQVRDLVGHNGRTMPLPNEVEARAELERIHVEITDALRAAGSLLDVLGGLTVLFLGLPVSPPFAESRHLLSCRPEPEAPSEEQRLAVLRFREAVDAAVRVGPTGWVAWTLESRNAMVHRGRAIAMWLPMPTRAERHPIFVVTDMDRVRVLRQFPYLRRQPDLSDAESALSGRKLDDTLLREPAQDTLDGLRNHMSALTAAVVAALLELIADLATFVWPTERWAIAERSSRALLADEFSGFGDDPAPISLDAIVLNSREAKRLSVMEQLRREQAEARDDDY